MGAFEGRAGGTAGWEGAKRGRNSVGLGGMRVNLRVVHMGEVVYGGKREGRRGARAKVPNSIDRQKTKSYRLVTSIDTGPRQGQGATPNHSIANPSSFTVLPHPTQNIDNLVTI